MSWNSFKKNGIHSKCQRIPRRKITDGTLKMSRQVKSMLEYEMEDEKCFPDIVTQSSLDFNKLVEMKKKYIKLK